MRAIPTAGLAGLALSLLITAGCDHTRLRADNYNAWKERCYELADLYKTKLKIVPYHMMANRESDRCSSPLPDFVWKADSRNMYILVANLLYHYDFDVRVKALDMLEDWDCEAAGKCKELARLLDEHIAASLNDQPPDWKRLGLHDRARRFWNYLVSEKVSQPEPAAPEPRRRRKATVDSSDNAGS